MSPLGLIKETLQITKTGFFFKKTSFTVVSDKQYHITNC